jgi:DHA1 family inner membrane transport protein
MPRSPAKEDRSVAPRHRQRRTGASRGLPAVVYVLAVGTFLLGNTEFMIAGLLPEMATSLNISESRTGLLITAFAIGMIGGSPLMTLLTLRLPRRTTLTGALLVFSAGHIMVASTTSFSVAFGARVLTAFAAGAFWSLAAVVATDAVPPSVRTKAVSIVMSGATLSSVVGVPVGSYVGRLVGWQGPFWGLAAMSLLAAVVIFVLVPAGHPTRPRPVLKQEFAALRNPRLWLALSLAVCTMGGITAVYSYLAPLLTEGSGLAGGAVSLVLVGFGVGAISGTTIGGRLGDRRPLATSLTASLATSLTCLLVALLAGHGPTVIALLVIAGLSSFVSMPVAMARAVHHAGGAPTLTSALSTSSFNVGAALGSWLAGLALDSRLDTSGPPLVAAAITALAVVPVGGLLLFGHHESRSTAQSSDATGFTDLTTAVPSAALLGSDCRP